MTGGVGPIAMHRCGRLVYVHAYCGIATGYVQRIFFFFRLGWRWIEVGLAISQSEAGMQRRDFV